MSTSTSTPASLPALTDLTEVPCFIDGAARPAESGRTYESIDPYRDQPWIRVADAGEADVDLAVDAARRALQGAWAALTATARGRLLIELARLVRVNAEELANADVNDNGKLLKEMRAQAEATAAWLEYFGGLADKVQGTVIPVDKPNYLVYTQNVPVGVVAAIVPWNSPLLLLIWKLAPALAAGCTVVVKPSEVTPTSTVMFADLARQAGFPAGVINVVTGEGPTTGQALVAHPGVDKIAFTGSTAVGRVVATAAAARFAKVTLELGGKSAQIVFPDADLDAAANGVLAGIFAAAGQTCIAGSRLVVHRDVVDELVERIAARARAIKLGDPRDPATEMGPLASGAQFQKVTRSFQTALRDGGDIVCGGRARPDIGPLFVEPTVITGLDPTSSILQEEIFGPVLAVATFDDEAEAVLIANGTPFSLAGSVWTNDLRRAHRVARALTAGTIWVNSYRTVAPQVPFGGHGDSGVGRESGIDAVKDYLEVTAVWVELEGASRDPFVIG